jgi:ABC-type glycerol-3-phosphate transport system substrate-binding protein
MKNAARAATAVAFACIVALAVSACGGGDGDSPGDTSSAKLSGTVTVWDTNYKIFPEYTKAIEQIDAEFEKAHPAVKVERVSQPEEGYLATVRTALLSGEVPDVMGLFPGYGGVLNFKDSLEVLNDRIGPELEETLTQWSSVTPGLTEEGDHYGVPSGMNGAAFYYNKKLFAKAGLPTDFHPDSWQDLVEAGEKLKAAGIQPFVDGDKGGQILSVWMYGLGLQTETSEQDVSEIAEGKVSYTDPRIAKGFGPLTELYEAGLYPSDIFSTEFVEAFTRFEEEEGAMVLGLWSVVGSYLQFDPKLGEENVGMFPAPGAAGFSTFSSQPRAIPIAADNKDAAWALLEFEASKKSVETLLKVGNSLPIRKDVPLPADELSQGRELVEAAQNGETEVFPLIALPWDVEITVANEFGELLQGRTSVEDVQKVMQESAEKSAS